MSRKRVSDEAGEIGSGSDWKSLNPRKRLDVTAKRICQICHFRVSFLRSIGFARFIICPDRAEIDGTR
jgi:hypothetical protein